MSKKNIEELYQEKLDGFTPLPDEHVWNRISASLDRKRRKRVLPVWWLSAGAAATLALLIYLNLGDSNTNRYIEGNASQVADNEAIESTQESVESASELKNENQFPDKIDLQNQESIVEIESAVAKNEAENTQNTLNNTKEYVSAEIKTPAKTNNQNQIKETTNSTTAESIAGVANTIEKTKKVAPSKLSNNKNVTQNQEENVTTTIDAVAENNSDNKKSIYEAIAEKEEDNALDKAGGKWSVGPSVASVYYDAFGEGSPINSTFDQNTKEGTFNFSYGLQVAYEVSKKITVRSGVHRLDFGYNTNDITFTSSLDASRGFANVDYNDTSGNILISSKVSGSDDVLAGENAVREEFTAKSPRRDGVMVQEFGYLEVPFELSYRLVDNKIGVSLNGGLSSMFLIDNSISLESQGNVTQVGEANNLNNLNFSTNFGLGIDYQFLPNMKLMMEPMLKYQLNTFSETSGDFNPYAIGIYSSILYKF